MADNDPKHAIVETQTPVDEKMVSIPESVIINTLSYYEQLSGEREEVQKHIKTSSATVLSDIMSCLDVLKGGGTPELTITIKSDRNNLPALITKRYTTKKVTHNKR